MCHPFRQQVGAERFELLDDDISLHALSYRACFVFSICALVVGQFEITPYGAMLAAFPEKTQGATPA
jgi:hypothetical protein